MTGRVSHLFLYDRKAGRMRPVSLARALDDHGLEGCGHARPGHKRQLLLVDGETIRSFGLEPGQVKENVTTAGIDIQALQPGRRVRVGQAVVEITGPCEPCGFMDTLRPGLRAASEGKRGVLARVVVAGAISVGDGIEPLEGPGTPVRAKV